jgi:hypothetical protein
MWLLVSLFVLLCPVNGEAATWTTGLTHIPAAGANRLLVFITANEATTDRDITAVTYGGQNMTIGVEQVVNLGGLFSRAEIWYLDEAGISASAGSDFVVTYTGSPSESHHAAATFSQINQASPIVATASSTTTSGVTISTPSFSVVQGGVSVAGAAHGAAGSYNDGAWGAGWVEGSDQAGASATLGTADTDPPYSSNGSDSATATHTISTNRQVMVAASLRPAATCPTVTNTLDYGPGSLRDCIAYANSNAGTTIVFDIPDTAPGYTTSGGNSWWRIAPTSALPAITGNGTVIDGTTQAANYGADTNSLGPEIEIDGSGAGAGVSGLTVNVPGGNATISHLVVDNFSLSGILLQGGSTTVTGSYLGLEPDGDTLAGNNTSTTSYHGGIRIVSAGNTIGGTDAADRNVISGNTLAGIVLNGAGATGNQVLGNYIGLDATGTLDRGNIFDGEGIEFQLADGNTIGGTAAGARNVISGNASDGMEIDGSSNNVIQGNYIGTDYTGTVVIPNDRDGIDINSDLATGSTGNLIGGTAAGAGNLIRGNALNGVELRDDTVVGSTTDNSILGNLIYGNGDLGIDLEPVGVTLNDAGDGDAGVNGLQNFPVITAASSLGISTTVTGTLSSQPTATYRLEFYYNATPDPLGYGEGDSFLGTTSVTTDGTGDASFTVNFPVDLTPGMEVTATATSPTGSTSEFAANVAVLTDTCPTVITTADTGPGSLRQCIAYANSNVGTTIVFDIPDTAPGYTTSGGNSWWRISPASVLPTITANGTVIDGTTQASNYGSDTNSLGPEVEIDGSGAGAGVAGFTITGGGSTVEGLVINRFGGDGVLITNNGGNTIIGNYIGTDPSGTADQGNGDEGVDIRTANNTVGGTAASDRNIISGNADDGLAIESASATGNSVMGNYIGIDATGNAPIANDANGVAIKTGASDNIVGGSAAGAGNIISGNTASGLVIRDGGTTGNTVQGNLIGTDATGTLNVGNTASGIQITGGAQTNAIGGTGAGEGNTIAYSGQDGVWVDGATTTQNPILGNLIYDNGGLGIDLAPDGVTSNDAGDGDAGPNNLQNYPVITARITNGVTTTVTGTLNSQPTTTFWLEFYWTYSPDPLGYGEAESFLGTATVTTNAVGNAPFTVTLPAPLPVGAYTTVTATDPAGNTSEFSEAFIDPPTSCPTVTRAADEGVSTLRECINLANLSPGTNITFNIPNTDPGYTTSGGNSWWRIAVDDELPEIRADGTTIDGTTQTINQGNTNSLGPEIEITSGSVRSKSGLVLLSSNNVMKGLIIGGFDAVNGNGIELSGLFTSSGNAIYGNYIGTDHTGIAANANNNGIYMFQDTASNIIGGTGPGEGNVIAFNVEAGIWIIDNDSDNNLISGNSFFENGDIAIDLKNKGVTPNDAGDVDDGPNEELNFPVISSIIRSGTGFAVAGSVGAGNTVQFFRVGNPASPTVNPDPTGYGEGYLYIATAGALVEGGGSDGDPAAGSFRFTVPGTDLSTGDFLSSTAIDAANNTSEFSSNFVLPLFLVKQAVLVADGSLISNAATLPRGTVFKFLIYTENPGAARSDVSIRDVLDSAFAYSSGSLKVDNSAAVGTSVQTIYATVNGTAALSDTIDADVASITGSTIDVGDRFVGNGTLDILANRIWALLFTVRMQ